MRKFEKKRRILVVGEGRETEYNYLVGFRKKFEKELEATATSVSVARGKGGDARRIVKRAIWEARKFKPDRKLGDRVFLLLDTEGVGRAPELPNAENLAKNNGIEIIYSCPAFEYWLLCHFQNPSRANFKDCDAVIQSLDKRKNWNSVCETKYNKADQDNFDRLSHLLDQARAQALETDLHHLRTIKSASCTNPSTQVYELVAILVGARTGEKCPITGDWHPVGDGNARQRIVQGVNMPVHNNMDVRWRHVK